METLNDKKLRLKALQKEVCEIRTELEWKEQEENLKKNRGRLAKAVDLLNKKRSDGLTNLEFLRECKKPRKLVNHPILRNMKIGYFYTGLYIDVFAETIRVHKKFEELLDTSLIEDRIDLDTLHQLSKAFDFPEYKEVYQILSELNEIVEDLEDDGTLEKLLS